MSLRTSTIDSYPPMMVALVLFIFGLMTALSLIQLYIYRKGWRSIGYVLEQWSIKNDWFAGALLLVVGIFLAHFLLNPLPCPGPETPLEKMSPRCQIEAKRSLPPQTEYFVPDLR